MTTELMKRMDVAIKRLGGASAILDLPDEVRTIVVNCKDYETRVKMLEMIVDQLGK